MSLCWNNLHIYTSTLRTLVCKSSWLLSNLLFRSTRSCLSPPALISLTVLMISLFSDVALVWLELHCMWLHWMLMALFEIQIGSLIHTACWDSYSYFYLHCHLKARGQLCLFDSLQGLLTLRKSQRTMMKIYAFIDVDFSVLMCYAIYHTSIWIKLYEIVLVLLIVLSITKSIL